MKVTYVPSRDELILTIRPVTGRPKVKAGPLKLWWDKEGEICSLAIAGYSKELEAFRKSRGLIKLGGIWKGIQITEDDIEEARAALLKELEEKW